MPLLAQGRLVNQYGGVFKRQPAQRHAGRCVLVLSVDQHSELSDTMQATQTTDEDWP